MAYSCRVTLTVLAAFASVTAALHPAPSSTRVSRRDIGALTAGALLSVPARAGAALPSADRVPLFVITTADGSTPLFTDGDGTRASFFAERRDAEAKLKSLKGAGDATVMSLPLSEALDLRKQPASELGGEFTLSARKGERDDASAIAGAQADPDDLPLFFDPRLAAPSGEVYLFLKKGDVDKSWAKAVGGKPSAKTGFPQYQTTSVRALEGGKQGGPKFIIVSSEKF